MSRKTWKTFGGREKECKQGCRGYGDSSVDSMGIPTGFSVGMGWVWGLKSNPHGSWV